MGVPTGEVLETKFNQLNHEMEIFLDNGAGDTDGNIVNINPNAIVNLTMHTSLADWVTRGSITIMYNPENPYSGTNTPTGQYASNTSTETDVLRLSNRTIRKNYIFRNDGYDLLRIRIVPKVTDNTTFETYSVNSNKKFWTLSHLFSVYEKEDIDLPPGAQNAASATIKAYRLYFWDAWYQKLLTTYMEYSTALSQYANIEGDIAEEKYTNYGLIPTGRAMKEIIDLGLSESGRQENYTDTLEAASWLGGEPATAGYGEEWEEGHAKIFYTTPTFCNAFESLMYVYNKHISSTGLSRRPEANPPRGGALGTSINDFSLLYREKGPNDTDLGYLTLKPISKYFEKAGSGSTSPGEYQIEHFYLQSYTEARDGSSTKTTRAPTGNSDTSQTVDIKTLKYHTITNYRFVDISPITNSTNFNNKSVYSFDFRNREFNVEFAENKVTTAREFMVSKYINRLYKRAGDNNDSLYLITLNQDKEKSYLPEFSLDGDNFEIRQHVGLQKLLKLGVFQNLCINFRTLGLSYRVPGRFIGIDKIDGVHSGEFEDKFYGQWFIIDVKHVFEAEMYFNDITAIKVHRYDDLGITFPRVI
jgi:hypothetical protein